MSFIIKHCDNWNIAPSRTACFNTQRGAFLFKKKKVYNILVGMILCLKCRMHFCTDYGNLNLKMNVLNLYC